MNSPDYTWEPSPHTADLAIAIEAAEPAGLFYAAFDGLLGLLQIPAEPPADSEIVENGIEYKSCAIEESLVDFLNDCIYLMDAEDMLPFKIKSLEFSRGNLNATLICRPLKDSEHPQVTHIKAATYSNLSVEKTGDRYKARIIFDT
jgi:SHS2 domain-containing protein